MERGREAPNELTRRSLHSIRRSRGATAVFAVTAIAAHGLASLAPAWAQPTPVPTVTLLQGNGDPRREDIVILGDGYTTAEQPHFNALVSALLPRLLESEPLSGFQDVLNVYRVNISSNQSGTDDFVANCVSNELDDEGRLIPVPKDVDTALTTGFCGGGLPNSVHHLLLARDELRVHDVAALAGDYDLVLVIVNTRGFGGGAPRPVTGTNNSRFAFASASEPDSSPDLADVMLHEMGHALAALGDEYSDDSQPPLGPIEPSPANVTIQTDRTKLKWRSLVRDTTNIPTSQDSAGCRTAILPTLRNVVGTFAGAYYRSCGVYRPQADCRMRDNISPLCAVCLGELRSVLQARRLELGPPPTGPTVPPDELTPILDLTPVATPTVGTMPHRAPTTIRLVLGRVQDQIKVFRRRASYGTPRLRTARDFEHEMDSFLRGEAELIRYRAVDAASNQIYSGVFALSREAVVEAPVQGGGLSRGHAELPISIVHVDVPYSSALVAIDFARLSPTGTRDVSTWRVMPLGREQVSPP